MDPSNKAGTSEWWELLGGLLNLSQIKFVAKVCFEIRNSAQTIVGSPEAQLDEVKQLAGSMKVNFKLLVKKLKQSVSSRQRFLDKYPEWRDCRNLNVKNLRKIANTIDTDRQKAQDYKALGNVVSFIGGGMSLLAGGIFGKMLGTAMIGLGTVVSFDTIISEDASLQENIKKAKEIVELDMKYTKNLVNLAKDVGSFEEALDGFNSINCGEEFLMVSEKLQGVSEMYLSLKKTEEEIQKELKSFRIPENLRKEISDVIGCLISIRMLFHRYTPVFMKALRRHHAMSQLSLFMDLMLTTYAGVNSLSSVTNCGLSASVQRLKRGMLLDAISFLLVAAQDPNSAEGKEIRKIASDLEKDANEFKKIYEEIKTL